MIPIPAISCVTNFCALGTSVNSGLAIANGGVLLQGDSVWLALAAGLGLSALTAIWNYALREAAESSQDGSARADRQEARFRIVQRCVYGLAMIVLFPWSLPFIIWFFVRRRRFKKLQAVAHKLYADVMRGERSAIGACVAMDEVEAQCGRKLLPQAMADDLVLRLIAEMEAQEAGASGASGAAPSVQSKWMTPPSAHVSGPSSPKPAPPPKPLKPRADATVAAKCRSCRGEFQATYGSLKRLRCPFCGRDPVPAELLGQM